MDTSPRFWELSVQVHGESSFLIFYYLLPLPCKSLIKAPLGGLASQWMHDEDNRNGLTVTNKRGDVWVAFGDDNYFDGTQERIGVVW